MFMFFFFNDTATTEIYTLSLHDALPIFLRDLGGELDVLRAERGQQHRDALADRGVDQLERLSETGALLDRKSTRLNSSHANISYAVFCLKKKSKSDKRLVETHMQSTTPR